MNPMEEKFKAELRKKLEAFKSAKEWSDFISLLSSLDRTIKGYDCDFVPELNILTKRLTQCLSSALPAGVHTKTLQSYTEVFNKFSEEKLIKHFDELTFGFFTAANYLKTMAYPTYLNIFKEKIIPIASKVQESLENILIGLLPFVESESSELFHRGVELIDELKSKVSFNEFCDSLWMCFYSSKHLRICVINYLNKQQSPVDIKARDSVINAINAALRENDIIVLRGTLDILIAYLPLNQILHFSEAKEIVLSILKLFLWRDVSLNKRIVIYINLNDRNNFKLVKESLKLLFNEEIGLFYKIMIALADYDALYEHLISKLLVKSLFALQKEKNSKQLFSLIFVEEKKIDNLKSAEIFFDSFSKSYFWNEFIKKLEEKIEKQEIFLERSDSPTLKGGRETNISEDSQGDISENSKGDISENSKGDISENSKGDISENSKGDISENSDGEIETLTDDERKIDLITEKLSKINETLNENNKETELPEPLNENANFELISTSSNESPDKSEILLPEEIMEDEVIKEAEILKAIEEEEKIFEHEIEILKIKEGLIPGEQKSQEASFLETDIFYETHDKFTSMDYLDLMVFLKDNFDLIDQEFLEVYLPRILILITKNFRKFDLKKMLEFYEIFNYPIKSEELNEEFVELLEIENFVLFCSIFNVFNLHYNFPKSDIFWQKFFLRFVNCELQEKLKVSFIFYNTFWPSYKSEIHKLESTNNSTFSLLNLSSKKPENEELFDQFDFKLLFEKLFEVVNLESVKCIFVYNSIFNGQLEKIFLEYLADLNFAVIEKFNAFFNYLFNYLDPQDYNFFDLLVSYVYKLKYLDDINHAEEEVLVPQIRILEILNSIYETKLILSFILTSLKSRKNLYGVFYLLKSMLNHSESFVCTVRKAPVPIFELLIDFFESKNFDINYNALLLINLLISKNVMAKPELVRINFAPVFEFCQETKSFSFVSNCLLLLPYYKQSATQFLEFCIKENFNFLEFLFKMESKNEQMTIFKRIAEENNIYVNFRIVKFVGYSEFNKFISPLEIEALFVKIIKKATQSDNLVQRNRLFSFLLGKYSQITLETFFALNFVDISAKSKLFELVIKRIFVNSKSVNYLHLLNQTLTKAELFEILNQKSQLLNEVFLVNKKMLDVTHYNYILSTILACYDPTLEEFLLKIFNNLLKVIYKFETEEIIDSILQVNRIFKGKSDYKEIVKVTELNNMIVNIFTYKNIRDLSQKNAILMFDCREVFPPRNFYDYFYTNDFFSGNLDLKVQLQSFYIQKEQRFAEIFAKIDQGFYLSRDNEIFNKHWGLKRLAFHVLCGNINQFITFFPKLLERLIDWINFDPLVRKSFFLLLRVIIIKQKHNKLSNLWPLIFTEIFKLINPNSIDILKFLDLLFLINSPETREFKKIFFNVHFNPQVQFDNRKTVFYEKNSSDSIYKSLANEIDYLVKEKDILMVQSKKKPFFPIKKQVSSLEIKEYLVYAGVYYKCMEENVLVLDEKGIIDSLMVDFENE